MKELIILLFVLSAAKVQANSSLNSTAISYEDFMANPDAYSDQINQDGLWVTTQVSTGKIPQYAVYAGFEKMGPVYVARSYHVQGNFLGKYLPMARYGAVIYLDGNEYSKSSVEVLVHTNFVWANDNRPLIPNPGNSLRICRYKVLYEYYTPGYLDTFENLCKVPYAGGRQSNKYEMLRRRC